VLDQRDVVIVAGLASGSTHAEAGDAAGCSERTVRRRLADESVRAALAAERERVGQQIADMLSGRAAAAVDRLARVVTEGSDRDAVQACRIVLDMMTRHRDAVYVLDRLAALEDATARSGAA
jgi:hypothetical protein